MYITPYGEIDDFLGYCDSCGKELYEGDEIVDGLCLGCYMDEEYLKDLAALEGD